MMKRRRSTRANCESTPPPSAVAALALALSLLAPGQVRGAEVACHWDDPGLREYLTFLYSQLQYIDTDENEFYPGLEQHRDANLLCLREIVLHGPKIVPGIEHDLEELRKQSEPPRLRPLPIRGLAVIPGIVALDHAGGRLLVESLLGDTSLTSAEALRLANQLLPPPSSIAGRVLRDRLARGEVENTDLAVHLLALIRFSDLSDAAFIRNYLSSVKGQLRTEMEAQLHARLGETSPLVKGLASPDRIVSTSAADALLWWGHVREVCSFLRNAKGGDHLQGIAGMYAEYKTGMRFSALPDAVVEKIQAAPQVWECVRPGIALPPYLRPRDVSRDPAATWKPRSTRTP